MSRDPLAARVRPFATTVFSEFSALAQRHGAVNLGQGFPDFDGPEEIREAAVRALRDGRNQYAPGPGVPELRAAVAEHAARFYGQTVDPDTMVTVTSGATEAIFDAVQGLVDPGDEVVLFEPFYDSYLASVTMAGGVPRGVLLRPPDAAHPRWWFDEAEVRAAFGPRTRLVILNTPHNPTGKVFDRRELELVAELCQRHGALALADEVYEHLAFAPARHLRLATLPGMAERTVTLSSGGKTFSFTGWKVGWAVAAPPLRAAVQRAHQWVTFATSTPFQHAIAEALRLPDAFFDRLGADYARRRDVLLAALFAAGLPAHAPEGTYFAMADVSRLRRPDGSPFTSDVEACRWLTASAGVAAIPPSVFYLPEHADRSGMLARFAFCKTDAVLAEGARRLGALGA